MRVELRRPALAIAILFSTLPVPADDENFTPAADGTASATGRTSESGLAPATARGAFVWPVSAWVTATSTYRWGERHIGSADLAAPQWTPIGAARDGVVTFVGASRSGAYGVVIDHEDGYRTHYYHLVAQAVVRTGERVRANQHIGWVGRTGLASNPHCHFALIRNGEFLKIPGLRYGTWITRGEPIPGDWAGLADAEPVAPETFPVVTAGDGLDVRDAPDGGAAVVGRISGEALLTVFETRLGFYRIRQEGNWGWIPDSGVHPAASDLSGVETVVPAAILRVAPSPSAATVGTVRSGTPLTVYETRDGGSTKDLTAGGSTGLTAGWYRVLHGYPARYAWIASTDVRPTARFRVMVSAEAVETRSAPDPAEPVRDVIPIGENNTILEVQETRNGWYRILHRGAPAWIPGWKTAGRI